MITVTDPAKTYTVEVLQLEITWRDAPRAVVTYAYKLAGNIVKEDVFTYSSNEFDNPVGDFTTWWDAFNSKEFLDAEFRRVKGIA
jgi:hypothetical protein